MIHVFHGFLGSSADFAFLKSQNVILHDLSSTDLEQLVSRITPQDILLGYSLGGRFALELASRVDFKIQKLVLLGAHPGLESEAEKAERVKFEEKVLEYLKRSKLEFLDWWNSLPLFKNDEPLSMVSDETFKNAPVLFERMRLSRQKNFLPSLKLHRDKVLWIVGDQDEKYLGLLREKILPLGIAGKNIAGGHRLFQKPQALLRLLKDEDIL